MRTDVAYTDRLRWIGKHIEFHRRRSGMTQRELAARIGRTNSPVSRIESGMHDPNITLLAAIADALKVSIEDLLIVGPPRYPHSGNPWGLYA